jgi:hypothetical protein
MNIYSLAKPNTAKFLQNLNLSQLIANNLTRIKDGRVVQFR